jgi:periplasmic divalent cation tolerance protein
MSLLVVVTTVGQLDDARRIARALVEQRLVACAQISEIESCYRWQGQVCEEREYRLQLKTLATHYAAVEAAILALHPFALPAIHAVPVAQASAAYADWVAEATRPATPPPDA